MTTLETLSESEKNRVRITDVKAMQLKDLNRTTLHADILQEPIVFDAGYIAPPTSPGLGADLNEDVLARHIVQS